MARCTRLCIFALLPLAWVLVASAARAQTTTTTSGPAVAANPLQAFPNRFVNGVNLGQSTRPVGLNPDGINFSDCISNMTLQYSVELSGFTGESLEVWASTGADCSVDTNRGNGGVPECWYVANEGAINQVAETAVNVNVRVQDIVGLQQAPPSTAVLVNETSSACYAQPTSSATTITLFFLPVSGITFTGTDYSQQLTTDLVGPAAPSGVSVGAGDTLFVVDWTPNDDADTQDYDVFIDPIPGEGDATASAASMTTVLVCPDATTANAADATVVDDDDEDGLEASIGDASVGDETGTSSASSGANSSTAAGSACHYENIGPTGPVPGSTSCNSSILQSSSVIDSGVTSNVIEAEDGAFVDSGTSTGPVGISTIPCDNLLNVPSSECASGQPAYTATAFSVNGESNGTYTVKGLTNFVTYNIVVAAVDGSGNVGPPSTEACNYPAPVNDFWDLYREAGGQAGGGFCALRGGRTGLEASSGSPVVGSPIAFGVLAATAIAAGRRRRRKSK